MPQRGTRDWRDSNPVDASRLLERAGVPWWIAGGWALDLHCGHSTREHADLDVGCFRTDLPGLRAELGGWVCYAAYHGTLTRIEAGAAPPGEVNSVWCRPETSKRWWLEVLLDERDGQDWVFRRSPKIRRLASDITLTSADGIPYLRPELQLLYKAKATRPRDEDDFRLILPMLDEASRHWLHESLGKCEPEHDWLKRLEPDASGPR